MTNPGPWTPAGTTPQTKQSFGTLDILLILAMIVSGLMFAFALFFGINEGDDQALVISGLSLTVLILSSLGRVVIHIAQTLDRMANAGVSVQPTK